MLIWILTAVFIIGLDQWSKYMVLKHIAADENITIINNVIDFIHVRNTGAAFSILKDSTWLLSLISIAFCVGVIIYWIREKPKHSLFNTGLTMLFAGAFGNGIDRIFRGSVVDFIKLDFIDFPIFNIADISIVIGACLCIVYTAFFCKGDEEDDNIGIDDNIESE